MEHSSPLPFLLRDQAAMLVAAENDDNPWQAWAISQHGLGGSAHLLKAGAQAGQISEVPAMKLMLVEWPTDKHRCALR